MARNLNHNGQIADLNYDDICTFPYNFAITAVTPFTTINILKFVYIFPFHYDLMTLVSSDNQKNKSIPCARLMAGVKNRISHMELI